MLQKLLSLVSPIVLIGEVLVNHTVSIDRLVVNKNYLYYGFKTTYTNEVHGYNIISKEVDKKFSTESSICVDRNTNNQYASGYVIEMSSYDDYLIGILKDTLGYNRYQYLQVWNTTTTSQIESLGYCTFIDQYSMFNFNSTMYLEKNNLYRIYNSNPTTVIIQYHINTSPGSYKITTNNSPFYSGSPNNVLDYITSIANNNKYIYSYHVSGVLQEWHINSGSYSRLISSNNQESLSFMRATDTILVTGFVDGRLAMYLLEDKSVVEIKAHNDVISYITITKTHVITGSWDGTIKMWRKYPNYLLLHKKSSGNMGQVTSIVVSDEDDTIYSSSTDGTVRLWKY